MLVFDAVSKYFDGRPALVGASLTIAAGSRTAVVGVNGAGKSTLLRLVAGLIKPDAGAIRHPPGLSVAYVPQDYGMVAHRTVREEVKARAGVLDLEGRLRELEVDLVDDRPGAAEAYAETLEDFQARGGWEVETHARTALDRVGLSDALLDRRLGELSGGEQVRVGLASVLASRHDCYLLDEPTTNLDLPALELLEGFVAGSDATFVLVSHDRAFLATTATDVVEIDEQTHGATVYGVPFEAFQRLREQALAAHSVRYRAYLAEVDRLGSAIQVKAITAARNKDRRPRSDNDKYSGHFLTQRAAGGAGKAKHALERRLDRIEAVEEPRSAWELRLSLEAAARSGTLVADIEAVQLRLGSFALGPLSLRIHWQERVALMGRNGAGKSLLLALLTGALEPDDGRVRTGPGVRMGVLRQGGADLMGEQTGLAAFRAALGWRESEARTLLAKFDLGAAHVLRPVDTYSPGERCRLGLAILMAQGANCLILDEPTNHLDLEATDELEQALAPYAGTLVLVTHDREFLARVGVTRQIELVDGRLVRDDPL